MADSNFHRPSPRSPEHSKLLFSNDRIKTLTKQKIQEYVESFFSAIGANRGLLGSVSPSALTYNIDRSFDPKTDPTQKKLQIARYFQDLQNILPAILIMDGGVIAMNQSIGSIAESTVIDGNWTGFYPIFRKVPISILAAHRDQDSIDDMSGLLSLMFNELRNLAGGSHITGRQEEGETWVITLPNGGITIGAVSDAEIQSDPVDRIWYAEASFEVFFEDTVIVKQPMPTISEGGYVVNRDPSVEFPPEIVIPDQISINTTTILLVRNFKDSMRIVISDPNVASLTYDMRLTPRRWGQFDIVVIDKAIPDPKKQEVGRKTVIVV